MREETRRRCVQNLAVGALVRALALLLVAALAACGGAREINLTIVADPSLDATLLAQVRSLEIAVLGAEPSSVRYTIGKELSDGKTTWVYKSKVDAPLQFEIVARGEGRKYLAGGKSKLLTPSGSAVADTVTLGLAPPNPTKRRLGQSCAGGVDTCSSGFCVDGVCCETACEGACNTCNGTRPGTCTPALPGTSPRKACVADTTNLCGLDGTCDGAGQCRIAPAGKVCAQPSCAAGIFTPTATCDGAGTCSTPATRDCTPYACNAMNTACATICTAAAGCAPTITCASGSCGKLTLGGRCFSNNACANAQCVDGFCCDTTCTEGCKSCKEPGKEGTCVNVAQGSDDPHKQCVDEGIASCGKSGKCDGGGGCALYGAGVLCGAGACSADNTSVTAPRVCSGDGTPCPEVVVKDCAPYVCSTDGSPGCEESCGECTYYEASNRPPFAASCGGGTSCVDRCLDADARYVCQ